jgi:hypothetical protein
MEKSWSPLARCAAVLRDLEHDLDDELAAPALGLASERERHVPLPDTFPHPGSSP